MIDAAQAAGGGPVGIEVPLPGKAFQRAGWPEEWPEWQELWAELADDD